MVDIFTTVHYESRQILGIYLVCNRYLQACYRYQLGKYKVYTWYLPCTNRVHTPYIVHMYLVLTTTRKKEIIKRKGYQVFIRFIMGASLMCIE